jgi:hypothetical protein
MKQAIILLGMLLQLAVPTSGQNRILIDNATEQRIMRIDYWIGPENQAQSPGLVYKSKGAIEKDNHEFKIDESFHKKKRNTILVRATLSGGGYVNSQYNISKDQSEVRIQLFNPASEVSTDNFKSVIDKFKEFNFDKEYLKLTNQNALLSTLGALFLFDSEEKNILYIVTPRELKSQLTEICKHNNQDYAQGTFSTSTAVSGNINLPFVSINSSFSNGDVAKFTWSIENAGECIWAPANEKDLATLFSELSQNTKDALLQSYKDNPNAKLKFINKVFIIGRIEIETVKSKQVDFKSELVGSSFVTAKGNYSLNDDLKTKNVINDVVTKLDGYYVTGLLANQYLLSIASARQASNNQENQRTKEEFKYLLQIYPDFLTNTEDTELMKRQIVDLNRRVGGITYLKKTEGIASVSLQEVTQQNQNVGDVKSTENK